MEVVKERAAGKKRIAGLEFSLAELDEALFQVDKLLDFQCRIEERDGKDYIYLNLTKAASETLDEQRVRRVLETLPALRNGLDQDKLKVVLYINEGRFPVSKGTGKRKIYDNREGPLFCLYKKA